MIARARRPALACAIGVALASAELAAMPLTRLRDAPPRHHVYDMLATLPTVRSWNCRIGTSGADFPRHAEYMLHSTAHWLPLINGYSDHIPQDFRDTVIPLSSFPTRESFNILSRADTRYVVFHLRAKRRAPATIAWSD